MLPTIEREKGAGTKKKEPRARGREVYVSISQRLSTSNVVHHNNQL